MKKTVVLSVVAAMSILVACNNDDGVFKPAESESVSFTVSLESPSQSRADDSNVVGAVGDEGVTRLIYNAYYLNSTDKPVEGADDVSGAGKQAVFNQNGTATLVNGKAQINISLPKGVDYVVAFWAQNPDCNAWKTDDLRALTLDYSAVKNNDPSLNAFSGHAVIRNSNHANAQHPHQVYLRRAVAQINVGANLELWNNFAQTADAYTKSKVTLKDVPTTLDILTGLTDLTKKQESVVYETAEFMNGKNEVLTVPHDDFAEEGTIQTKYRWVSMCYVLAGRRTTNTVDATFEFSNAGGNSATILAPNLPIQRNYRTNVLGRVLSEIEPFEVILDRRWQGNDNDVLKVDQSTFTESLNYAGQNILFDLENNRMVDADDPTKARVIVCNDITIKNGTLGAGQIQVNATGTVTLENLDFETLPENTNAVFTNVVHAKRIMINSAEEIVMKDINTSKQIYARNGLELAPISKKPALDAVGFTPAACRKITIENCDFIKMDNNCLSIYVDDPNMEIDIRNCHFEISDNVTGKQSLRLTGQPGQVIRVTSQVSDLNGGVVNAKINIEDCSFEYFNALTNFPERPDPVEGTHDFNVWPNRKYLYGFVYFDAYGSTDPAKTPDMSGIKLSLNNIRYGSKDGGEVINDLEFRTPKTLVSCSYTNYNPTSKFFRTVTLNGAETPLNAKLLEVMGTNTELTD